MAGRPILEWVVNRLGETQTLDEVVVVAADSDATDEVVEVVPLHATLHVSKAKDSLSRVLDALKESDAESLAVVSTDSPLVDSTLVDRLVSTAASDPSADFATFYSVRNGSPLHGHLGLLADWVRVDALRSADRLFTSPLERDAFCESIAARPDKFTLKLLRAPAELDRDDVRLALESIDDWTHAEEIVDALGYDLDWHDIAHLLDAHPSLRQKMADLNAATC